MLGGRLQKLVIGLRLPRVMLPTGHGHHDLGIQVLTGYIYRTRHSGAPPSATSTSARTSGVVGRHSSNGPGASESSSLSFSAFSRLNTIVTTSHSLGEAP